MKIESIQIICDRCSKDMSDEKEAKLIEYEKKAPFSLHLRGVNRVADLCGQCMVDLKNFMVNRPTEHTGKSVQDAG